MFGTLGGPELFLILVVALIVFGPRKLPDIGKSVGKMMAEFRKASNDFKRTIEDEVEAEKLREATRIEAPSWTSEPTPAALPPASTDPAPSGTAESVAATGEESPAVQPEASSEAPAAEVAPAETVSRGALPDETK